MAVDVQLVLRGLFVAPLDVGNVAQPNLRIVALADEDVAEVLRGVISESGWICRYSSPALTRPAFDDDPFGNELLGDRVGEIPICESRSRSNST